jgi:hypothetical protein
VFCCISLAATVRVFRPKDALHTKHTVRIGGYTFLFGRHELALLLQILISRDRFFSKRVQIEHSATQYLSGPEFEEFN